MSETKKPARAAKSDMWSDEERAAMQEAARERKKAPKPGSPEEREQGELDVRAKIAGLAEPDRSMAERVYEIVSAAAPDLVPRTFYGMPAFAKAGKVVCFFQPKSKFKVRYSTLGFQHDAKLDDGPMWPVSFALVELTPETEARIAELARRAAG
jgi:uncharacterized protein YdhG (YjbR/CyaY superfamily)